MFHMYLQRVWVNAWQCSDQSQAVSCYHRFTTNRSLVGPSFTRDGRWEILAIEMYMQKIHLGHSFTYPVQKVHQ